MTIMWTIYLIVMVAWFVGMGWWGTSISKTKDKRISLINNCGFTGDHALAIQEFEQVRYEEHMWSVFFCRNTKRLYGPLMQDIWNVTSSGGAVLQHSEFWWRCYREIYCNLPLRKKRRINHEMGVWNVDLVNALISFGHDPWVNLKTDPEPKFSMIGGAEEYEQIMAAQDAMQ